MMTVFCVDSSSWQHTQQRPTNQFLLCRFVMMLLYFLFFFLFIKAQIYSDYASEFCLFCHFANKSTLLSTCTCVSVCDIYLINFKHLFNYKHTLNLKHFPFFEFEQYQKFLNNCSRQRYGLFVTVTAPHTCLAQMVLGVCTGFECRLCDFSCDCTIQRLLFILYVHDYKFFVGKSNRVSCIPCKTTFTLSCSH